MAFEIHDILSFEEMTDDDRALAAEVLIVGDVLLSDNASPPTIPEPEDFQCPYYAAIAYAAVALRLANRKPTPEAIFEMVKTHPDAGDFDEDTIEGLRENAKSASRADMVQAGMFLASRSAQKNVEQLRVMLDNPTLN